jgi:hypothetical protein
MNVGKETNCFVALLLLRDFMSFSQDAYRTAVWNARNDRLRHCERSEAIPAAECNILSRQDDEK